MTAPPSQDKSARALAHQAAIAERAATVARLQQMPLAMRAAPQWLLWRYIDKPGAKKPAKVPFYVSGQLRGWPAGKPRDGKPTDKQPQVEQGHALDRAALTTLDDAVKAFEARPMWAGVGFAFLPGDGLIGVDIDGAIDPESGEVSALCRQVVDLCASYTETSPSGRGVHIILQGESGKFKDDALGLEVYAGGQYFTCTGAAWGEMPAEVQPADPLVLAYLRELVDESKARQAADKVAAAEAAATTAPPPPTRPQAVRHPAPGQQTNDFKTVNDAAYQALQVWVPQVFAGAKAWRNGYRVTSKALGRELQEDLQLLPEGIMDFGTDKGLSPIDVVMQWQGCSTPKDALHWLAGALGIALQRPALRSVAPPPPPPPPSPPPAAAPGDVAAPAVERPSDVSADFAADMAGDGPPGDDPPPADAATTGKVVRLRTPGRGKGAKPGKAADGAEGGADAAKTGRKIPQEAWDLARVLNDRFALIYSTDAAWDRLELMIVRVAAMRLAFGKLAVSLWLDSKVGPRQMIRPVDLVFEPGTQVLPPQINMFAGLELEPVPGPPEDVAPMMKLLRHLCSETDAVGDDVDAVMHWVLCWQALPLQRLGTKMASAVVMHGAQGTGKNLYWDVWRDLYGEYGITVGQTELEEKYNAWISRRLAIIGDEVVSRLEMYHTKNVLKRVVTQEEKMPIRRMNMDTVWESNHANVVFLSNESQPLALEERDRRYLVIYTPLEAAAELYEEVRDWKRAGGAAKWMHYLMTYPLGDFTAHTKPIMTQAKLDLIELAWKAPARFCHEWLSGVLDLRVQVCSAEQLYRAFRRWCDRTGAKWPPDQAGFTAEVKRFVRERVDRFKDGPNAGQHAAPALVYKVIALKDKDSPAQVRKTVRCWLPHDTGPGEVGDGLPYQSEGAWAWDSVRSFEDELHRFCRTSGGQQPEDEA